MKKRKNASINLEMIMRNESLSDLVTNKTEFNQITEYGGRLIQRADPVFHIPESSGSHFYAPKKWLFGKQMETITVNLIMLWFMSVFSCGYFIFRPFLEVAKPLCKLEFLEEKGILTNHDKNVVLGLIECSIFIFK